MYVIYLNNAFSIAANTICVYFSSFSYLRQCLRHQKEKGNLCQNPCLTGSQEKRNYPGGSFIKQTLIKM